MDSSEKKTDILKNSNIEKPYSKKYTIKDNTINIVFENAKYKKIGDDDILLDKVSIDYMLDEIAHSVKNNLSNFIKLPKTIVISDEIYTSKNTTNQQNNNLVNLKKNVSKIPLSKILLKKSINPNESKKNEILSSSNADDFLKIYKPRFSFDDVYVEPAFKQVITSALILAKQKDKLYKEWGLKRTMKTERSLVLNFYGPPGTGKSMMAEAIAHYLGREVLLVNYSELESSSPGETPKNIVKVFNSARHSESVLIFDEADSFLGKRLTSVSSAADNSVNVARSVMLIELESFGGVVVFTTNFIQNYDIAIKRRILASLEFKLPDEKGRTQIWKSHLPEELPLEEEITPLELAYRYSGTSGADIKDIILFAAVNCLERESDIIEWDDFEKAYNSVKNRYSVI